MTNRRIFAAIIVLVVLMTVWWLLTRDDLGILLTTPNELSQWIKQFGIFGPIATGGLMAIAIIVSPIPSAPIALAAGAVYGHTFGTIYVLIGAEIGALIAFALARCLGKNFVDRWIGGRLPKTFIGTQNGLTLVILTSRLIPFLSFDVVSYAAGLTSISTLRFALATLAGMIPASFLLAHFGAELTAADTKQVLIALFVMALLMILPALIMALRHRRNNHRKGEQK